LDEIVEEYKDTFTLPSGVSVHFQVNLSIDIAPGAPLPNNSVYRCSIMKNEEIKRQILELILKGHIIPSSSPCGSLIVLVQKKDETWRLFIDYKSMNKITIKN
jgi:hypothetical protein